MSLSFALHGDAAALADTVGKFAAGRLGSSVRQRARTRFSAALWQELAELGIFMLGPDRELGGYAALVGGLEELGRAGCPGPLAGTLLAVGLLPAPLASEVVAGRRVVAIGAAPAMAWAAVADLFIELRDGAAWLLDAQAGEPLESLGDEQWARLRVAGAAPLGTLLPVLPRHDLALAAYLVGAGLGLVEDAAAHARDRRQFGRPIGDFQAVAMPLADAAIHLEAARGLVRAAAWQLDHDVAGAPGLAAMARVSAGRAARQAAFIAHQSQGAFGVTEDGPVFWLSRRIQQWAVQPPSEQQARARMPRRLHGALGLSCETADQAAAVDGLGLTGADAAFRAEIDAVLAPFRGTANFLVARDQAKIDAFYHALMARNWLALGWPEAVGGLGASPLREFLLWNEVAFAQIARPPQGVGVVAKTIICYGTAAQKATWLEPIRQHRASFALAYSEPEAGSDLAGLSCRAERVGDVYRVTGSKCWNSKAHHADYLWLLCRTGAPGSRGRGLSLLIVDVRLPGLRITPIALMDGNEFTEIRLDDVAVPVACRIGEENAAWSMMAASLADERHVHFGPGRVRRDYLTVLDWVERQGLGDDPLVQARLSDLLLKVYEAEALSLRVLDAGDAATAGWTAPAAKLAHTRAIQAIARAAMEFGSADAVLGDSPIALLWRQTMTESIGGGTTEIMQGIVARHRLGLGARA